MPSLSGGYSFYTNTNYDWQGYDMLASGTYLTTATVAECAAQSLSRGAHFFGYDAGRKECKPKNAVSRSGYSLLVLASSSTFYVLPNVDFNYDFDISGGVLSGPATTSQAICAQLCAKTPGCIVASFSSFGCALKTPKAENGIEAGCIIPPNSSILPMTCTSTTQCSASQCGTSITDNCGNSMNCPACPSPAPTACKPNPVTCFANQCGTTLADNCGNQIQCPTCPSPVPTACKPIPVTCSADQCGTTISDNCGNQIHCPVCPSPAPTGCKPTPVTCLASECGLTVFDNCSNKIQCPACLTSPTDSSAPSLGTGTLLPPPTPGPSAGLIGASVAAGLVVIAAAICGFFYTRRGKPELKNLDSPAITTSEPTASQQQPDEPSRGPQDHPSVSLVATESTFLVAAEVLNPPTAITQSVHTVNNSDVNTPASVTVDSTNQFLTPEEENPLFAITNATAIASITSSPTKDIPGAMNSDPQFWTVAQVADWVSRNGGTPSPVHDQMIDGRALLALPMDELLVVLQINTAGQRVQFTHGMQGLFAPPSYAPIE
ncbi:UNVERIFIED_CONTAM: hypothetical protein HDU68_005994 [Siphonaria sp. JEL0065]|nr:hypothetical protein HDU68_005994 [Siphonaria sp. JEL0065]